MDGETSGKPLRVNVTAIKAAELAWEARMNHSIHSADRATHYKIVWLALAAGIAVASLGISARSDLMIGASAHVTKAGAPVTLSRADSPVVR